MHAGLPKSRYPKVILRTLLLAIVMICIIGVLYKLNAPGDVGAKFLATQSKPIQSSNQKKTAHGVLIDKSQPVEISNEAVGGLIRQANPAYSGKTQAIRWIKFRYQMQDEAGTIIPATARVYYPVAGEKLPVLGFAPGTTGIDDSCAASAEVPAKRNWANYPSHMASYAANGYAAVIVDYEGMGDPSRIHHYMIGDLEGRALLDAVRTLTGIDSVAPKIDSSPGTILAGYSQGGHAAFWADQIASSYASDVTIKGVVGFGPVTDVKTTLTDTTRGANILWFGPYILRSYQDWYRENYGVNTILKSPFSENLNADIAKNCIDTNIAYWGNRDITKVYTSQFIQAMKGSSLAAFSPSLDRRLDENQVGTTKTSTPKLINHGQNDNVVLPSQSSVALRRLCASGSQVYLKIYPTATHYNTMILSLNDSLAWMKQALSGEKTATSCTN